jgi:hypothetical protein
MLAIWTTLLLQTASASMTAVPFGVGERLEYAGKLGFIRAGSAVLEVSGVESLRGHESWKFSFVTEVNTLVYKNRTTFTSWTGIGDFISRQFVKDVTENGRDRLETFRIYPDSGFYRRNANTETKRTPQAPLDDVAFFYWVRTIPLEVGHTYRFNRYFRDEHNPVIVRVEKRETKEMPDGTRVRTLLLRPIVNEDGGMFHERAKAKLWVTDDARRIPVEIQTDLRIGSLTLELRSYTPPSGGG